MQTERNIVIDNRVVVPSLEKGYVVLTIKIETRFVSANSVVSVRART